MFNAAPEPQKQHDLETYAKARLQAQWKEVQENGIESTFAAMRRVKIDRPINIYL